MHWLDTAFLVILVIGAALGARTGLVWQIARLACLASAVVGTIVLNPAATGVIQDHLLQGSDHRITSTLAYIAVFVLIYTGVYVVCRIIYDTVRATDFVIFDRLLGAGLGLVKISLILAGICFGLKNYQHEMAQELIAKSKLAPMLAESMDHLVSVIPEEFKTTLRDNWREFWQPLENVKKSIPEEA